MEWEKRKKKYQNRKKETNFWAIGDWRDELVIFSSYRALIDTL